MKVVKTDLEITEKKKTEIFNDIFKILQKDKIHPADIINVNSMLTLIENDIKIEACMYLAEVVSPEKSHDNNVVEELMLLKIRLYKICVATFQSWIALTYWVDISNRKEDAMLHCIKACKEVPNFDCAIMYKENGDYPTLDEYKIYADKFKNK